MKCCKVCNVDRPASEYYADKTSADGLRSKCKECMKSARRSYRAENKEKAAACDRAYRESEPGRQKRVASAKKRAATPEFKAYAKEWAKSEKGAKCRRVRVNKYAQTEKGAAANKRRRAARRSRRAAILNTLTAVEWNEILAAHDYRCRYCDQSFSADLPATQDHIIPISKGGHHTRDNIVPACKPCNSSKGTSEWPKLSSKRA
jgi:5-methylcytosine-specific restriction endonuclease McrA